jgi:hypothetical protein
MKESSDESRGMEFLCIERNACDKTGEQQEEGNELWASEAYFASHNIRFKTLPPYYRSGSTRYGQTKQAKNQMCIYIQEYKPLHLYGKRKQVQNINKLLHSILLCETNIILSN